MKMLEQADIDSLLSSAGDLANETELGGTPAAEEARRVPAAPLPQEFVLTAKKNALCRILPIKIPVSVQLAERRMNISQVLDFTVGTIVEFDRPADSELDLIAKNTPIGTGNAVKCGERFGLRVIKIEPNAQRLIGLGLYR